MAGAATRAARSALAVRLMVVSGAVVCWGPGRSRPDANWTAPNVSATALALKIPLDSCGMFGSSLAPMAVRDTTRTDDGSSRHRHHLTVFKKISEGRERI